MTGGHFLSISFLFSTSCIPVTEEQTPFWQVLHSLPQFGPQYPAAHAEQSLPVNLLLQTH